MGIEINGMVDGHFHEKEIKIDFTYIKPVVEIFASVLYAN